MPLSFPANPSVNQTSTQNGRVYRWSGAAWEFAGGGSGLTWSSVPASATASGTAGQIAYDGSNLYVCTATNTWVRYRSSAWDIPATIPGLQLWLDASYAPSLYDATSGGSLVAADGAVARWEDRSGNGRHATQSTSGSRPLRKTSVQGGRDVLRFDGSSDSLSIAGSTSAFNFLHSGDSTVFLVWKPVGTNDSTNFDLLLSNNISGLSIDNKTGFYIRWDNYLSGSQYNRTVAVVANNGQSRFVATPPNDSFAPDAWHVLSFVCDPANATTANRGAMRRNGGSALTLATEGSAALPTGDASYDLTIGKEAGADASHAGGDFAEIIMYDSALNDTDRAAVEGYLLAKWGIS